jgi:hypothetical protein
MTGFSHEPLGKNGPDRPLITGRIGFSHELPDNDNLARLRRRDRTPRGSVCMGAEKSRTFKLTAI